MTACPNEQVVADFLAHRVDASGARSIEEHFDGCVACRELVSALADMVATASDPPVEVSTERGRIGRFEPVEVLGAGGMGVVYAAHDPTLDRKVALKLLHDEAAAPRLVREAQALARLAHPNVVAVYEVGEHDGQAFIAMELVAGTTLTRWLRERPRTPREILDAFIQAGRGLAAAHATGFVHRDFKPDNVLVGADGRVRVTDFGLARVDDASVAPPPTASAEDLTMTGAVVGTPAYMAPEQLDGRPADARADQFAFCVALYEALCGVRPFAGRNVGELRAAIAAGAIGLLTTARATIVEPAIDAARPTLAGHNVRQLRAAIAAGAIGDAWPRLPARVRHAIRRGLAADPEARFSTLDELLAVLARPPSRRRPLIAASVLGAGALALAAWRLAAPAAAEPCPDPAPRLAGIWDGPRKAAIRAAFAATHVPYADDAWHAVERGVDGFARAWSTMVADSCAATNVRHDQSPELLDRRTSCLDRRLDELRALTDAFAGADRATVERAAAAAQSLGGLAECANRELVMASDAPPADPAKRAAVDAVATGLAAAQTLWLAGKPRDGVAAAERIVATARGLDHPPSLARALLTLGRAQVAVDPAAAPATLREAARVAEAARLDVVRADALIELLGASEEGAFAGGPALDAAVSLADDAGALVRRIGGDPRRETQRVLNLARVYGYAGRQEPALATAQQAVALADKLPDAAYLRATAVEQLGIAFHDAGRLDDSVAAHDRAQRLMEAELGAQHPNVAAVLHNRGIALQEQGKLADAKPAFERSLAIVEGAYGPDAYPVGQSLAALGDTIAYQGDPAAALPYLQRARPILAKAGGEANVLDSLGRVERDLHRPDDARRDHEAALALRVAKLGKDDQEVALSHLNLGQLDATLGRFADALAHYQEALRIDELALGPRGAGLVTSLELVGETLVELHRDRDAVAPLLRAIEVGAGQPAVAAARFALARARWELGAHGPARADAEAARAALVDAQNPEGQERLRRLDAWLASHR